MMKKIILFVTFLFLFTFSSFAFEITIVRDKFSSITNGFKREVSTTSTDYDYVMTYTYQKSSLYN